tara:strand:- start:23994 stop:24362 length:369 start_codon:yes stop_codon:yes gene_type:complete
LENLGPTLTDVAWLAGLIDGEGYVNFSKTPYIQVESITPALAYLPSKLFGGKVHRYHRNNASVFRWSVYGQTAISILKKALPFMKYKNRQAQIVINAGRYPKKSAMRQAQTQRLLKLRKLRH